MTKPTNFEKRFMSFGIIDDSEELDDFICGARRAYELFFSDDEDEIRVLLQTCKGKYLQNIMNEMQARFVFGFCEGAIFQNIGIIVDMIEMGFSKEDIIRITKASSKRIESIRRGLVEEERETGSFHKAC